MNRPQERKEGNEGYMAELTEKRIIQKGESEKGNEEK